MGRLGHEPSAYLAFLTQMANPASGLFLLME
jgi:hypothetical protein